MRISSIVIAVVASLLFASSSDSFSEQGPKSLAPVVVDMHFGALLGTGWLGNKVEPGNYINTVTLTSAKRGAFEINVRDTVWLREGMLICACDEGGEYYSYVVTRITGNRLQIDRPLESTIAGGVPIYNFYTNGAHPNNCGYRAIADDAIRQFRLGKRLEYPVQPTRWESLGGALIAPEKTNSYTNPGGRHDGDEALRVGASASRQGVVSGEFALKKGKHVTSLVVNPGEGTADNPSKAIISVEMETASGGVRKLAEQTIFGTGRIRAVNLGYDMQSAGNVKVRVVTQNEKGAVLQVGAVRNFQVIEVFDTADFANRKHVLLGDSWINRSTITKHLQERFPRATFVKKGIDGNKASQLLLRFGSDVVTQKPDYVWVISGTNDYYDPKLGQQDFQQYISELKILTAAIGAQMIVFTPSVGDITYNGPLTSEALGNSRRFALNTRYFDSIPQREQAGTGQEDDKAAAKVN